MKLVPNAISTVAGRTVLKAQNASPRTLFAIGIVGMGATVFLSCKATLQVERVIEEAEIGLEKIGMTEINNDRLERYSAMDARKDRAHVYLRAAVDLSRLYGPAIICGVVSVAALAGSHNILTKRNASLVAAYGTLEKTFNEYRARVRDAYGEDREKELYYDMQVCEIEGSDGKKKKVKVSGGKSPYAVLYDEHNVNWEADPYYNFLFLKGQQSWATQRLQAKGHLLLNDVYDALGLPRTPAGCVVGWMKDSPDSDGYVDFGFTQYESEEILVDFIIGREKAIWLDFNVDGVIYKNI